MIFAGSWPRRRWPRCLMLSLSRTSAEMATTDIFLHFAAAVNYEATLLQDGDKCPTIWLRRNVDDRGGQEDRQTSGTRGTMYEDLRISGSEGPRVRGSEGLRRRQLKNISWKREELWREWKMRRGNFCQLLSTFVNFSNFKFHTGVNDVFFRTVSGFSLSGFDRKSTWWGPLLRVSVKMGRIVRYFFGNRRWPAPALYLVGHPESLPLVAVVAYFWKNPSSNDVSCSLSLVT